MDARRFMIIDTSETVKSKMYITQKVCSIKLAKGMWHIVFDKSPTVYTYRRERIEFLKNPEKVDITDRGFYLRGKHIEYINVQKKSMKINFQIPQNPNYGNKGKANSNIGQ